MHAYAFAMHAYAFAMHGYFFCEAVYVRVPAPKIMEIKKNRFQIAYHQHHTHSESYAKYCTPPDIVAVQAREG